MVVLYYTKIQNKLEGKEIENLLTRFPLKLRNKISSFRNWKDSHACLFGRLLLSYGLKLDFNIAVDFNQIKYTHFGRPFLNHLVDFNISHSHNHVICGISDSSRIGVDLERITPIQLEDFRSFLMLREWDAIHRSEDSMKSFYYYWTRKESILKADGMGLSVDLNKTDVTGNTVKLNGCSWFLYDVKLDSDCICHLASNIKDDTFILKKINIVDINQTSAFS